MGAFQENNMNAPITTTAPAFPPVVFSITDAGIAELEAKHRGLVVAHDLARAMESAILMMVEAMK